MHIFRLLFILSFVAGSQFGASQINGCDSLKNETIAIQKSIDSCSNAGGGVVSIKPGIHLISPFSMKSKVTLNIEEGATLLASDNPDDYMADGRYRALINGFALTDVTITGTGIIDGNGASWWKKFLDSGRKILRPRLIVLSNIKNLNIEGITIKNSPSFHLVPTGCENVFIHKVTVLAPSSSPNTDGIDPSRSKNVKIIDCKIDVGDDNIAIKSAKRDSLTGFLCENIEIIGCTFYHGHGLSIGSETSGGVKNLKVENCKFYGTQNGIRIKSSSERGGQMENISYNNITMENVNKPIVFDFTYVDRNSIYRDAPAIQKSIDSCSNARDSVVAVKSNIHYIPTLRAITIKNLTATGAFKAGIMKGTEECVLNDITLENVNISAKTGFEIENAKGLKFNNVKIAVQKGEVYILKNAEGEGLK